MKTYRLKIPARFESATFAPFESATLEDALRYARSLVRMDADFDPAWLQVFQNGAWVYLT